MIESQRQTESSLSKCLSLEHLILEMLDDDHPTSTSAQQYQLEKKVLFKVDPGEAADDRVQYGALNGGPQHIKCRAHMLMQILPFYQEFEHFQPDELPEILMLLRAAHIQYLQNGIGQLPASFVSLDASRPWIVYWIAHSLSLLDAKLPDKPNADDVVFFLSCCQV